MATTVIQAFSEFQRDVVNLAADQTDLARRSRDWLFDKIHEFPIGDLSFPLVYPDKDIAFGSFERRTKIRPLDDIDLISCLHANGATYVEYRHDDIRISVTTGSRLSRLCHDETQILNSRKVINKYVNALSGVAQYRRADVNRRGEAATLQLSTYDWNFDIVPAFFTSPEGDGRTFYLIPNGDGHWKKTDPRMDRDRVAMVNSQHGRNMLNALRCIKYWQARPTMVTMPSYLLECIVVDYFEAKQGTASSFVDLELVDALRALAYSILGTVSDPKRIQNDINSLGIGDRISISARATSDAEKIEEARALEREKDMRRSIAKWREIFGNEFPEFG